MSKVNHPDHYQAFSHEVIELVRRLPFDDGNVVKYLLRAGLKGDFFEDIQKAAWYVKDIIENPLDCLIYFPTADTLALAESFAKELESQQDFLRAKALRSFLMDRSLEETARALDDILST